jgi:DNA-binding response OmpR family regulator
VTIGKPRVLLVDDEATLLELVSLMLRRNDIEPITADSARAAAQVLRTQPLPDLMILDVMMPEISGLPVLILSAFPEAHLIRDALKGGADRYLSKEFLGRNLITIVQEMLRAKGA